MIPKTVYVILACSLSVIVEGGKCVESYVEPKTCSRSTSYKTSCWLFFRCTKYRRVSYRCDETKYRYRCCDNWTGDDCSTPVCHGSTSCPNGGTCRSPNQCICLPGFLEPRCTDINECSTNNGGCEQICSNTHGSFRCSCESGYVLDSDGKQCFDDNECHTNNGGCQQRCDNLPGTFRCGCNDGYILNHDGKTCRDKNECTDNTAICQHNCTNTVGSYTCSCARGYHLSLDKVSCGAPLQRDEEGATGDSLLAIILVAGIVCGVFLTSAGATIAFHVLRSRTKSRKRNGNTSGPVHVNRNIRRHQIGCYDDTANIYIDLPMERLPENLRFSRSNLH